MVSVPLQRSHTLLPGGETHELCGARCILGDAAVLAPPPGPAAETWAADREERQRHCLHCEFMPLLGVLGVARAGDGRGDGPAGPFQASEITMLESIALSIAPVVENASLTQELRRSERFREHVLDSMAGALVAVDLRGAVLTFNRAAEDLLGFREAEVLGHPFGELVGVDGEAALHATLEHGREAVREEVAAARARRRARAGEPHDLAAAQREARRLRRHRDLRGPDAAQARRGARPPARPAGRAGALHLERGARDPQPAHRDRGGRAVPVARDPARATRSARTSSSS